MTYSSLYDRTSQYGYIETNTKTNVPYSIILFWLLQVQIDTMISHMISGVSISGILGTTELGAQAVILQIDSTYYQVSFFWN